MSDQVEPLYLSFSTSFRAAIERRVLNLPDIEPLDIEKLGKPLGPGYDNEMKDQNANPDKTGQWDLFGRKEDCDLSKDQCQSICQYLNCSIAPTGQQWLAEMEKDYKNISESMLKDDYETFGRLMGNGYHGRAHGRIGSVCSPDGCSFLAPTEASARDPIFYRWHLHIDELFEKYKITNKNKNRNVDPYTRENFALSDELEVLEVQTIMDKKHVGTINDIINTLVTYQEKEPRGTEKQKYKRINHKDFKYHIKLENPNKKVKKVIVRIWLALGRVV